MSFSPGMPAPGSSLGNTRQKFVDELAGIRSTMNANHVDQNDSGAGKHTFCQFVSVSDGVTSSSELALYNKTTAAGQRFFMRQPSSGTVIQMSGIDPIVSTTAGCCFLPGGLLIQWGGGSTTGKSTTVTYAKKSADGFVILDVIGLSLQLNTATYGVDNITSDGFIFKNSSGAGIGFGYCVIGTMP